MSHVVIVVGLVCFVDPWGYAVEAHVPERSKVRFQTKWDTGVYTMRGRSGFAFGTCLLIRRGCASIPVTA